MRGRWRGGDGPRRWFGYDVGGVVGDGDGSGIGCRVAVGGCGGDVGWLDVGWLDVGVLGRRGVAEEACLHGVALLDVSWLVYVEWICGIVSHHMAMIVTSQLWAIVGFVRRLWHVGGGGSV